MREQQSRATQERHERMLNALFQVPGNDRCADCAAKSTFDIYVSLVETLVLLIYFEMTNRSPLGILFIRCISLYTLWKSSSQDGYTYFKGQVC